MSIEPHMHLRDDGVHETFPGVLDAIDGPDAAMEREDDAR
jgi:hypothetical protein